MIFKPLPFHMHLDKLLLQYFILVFVYVCVHSLKSDACFTLQNNSVQTGHTACPIAPCGKWPACSRCRLRMPCMSNSLKKKKNPALSPRIVE